MIDATKGFQKDGPKNRLRERDIHRIVDVFNEQRETPGYARMVPLTEIASEANDYNLNIPRYIDSSDREDLHDLAASVRIPQQPLGFPRTGPWGVRRGTRGSLRVHLGMQEVDRGAPKIPQTLSAESPERAASGMLATTLLSEMNAEIAAVEYTAQKATQTTQKTTRDRSWTTPEGGASVPELSGHIRGQFEPCGAVPAAHPDADEQSRHLGLPAALLTRDRSRLQRRFQKPGARSPAKLNPPVTCGVIESAYHRHERRGKELLRGIDSPGCQ